MSALACVDAETLGIGTGTGMSTITCADAFGIGTGTGISALSCVDAAVINKTAKMNVPIVFFFKFPPSVVTRLLGAKAQQKSVGPNSIY
jgi:hypothetical protein